MAEVNLKFIWDVVSQIRVGAARARLCGRRAGRLIAHPDISLVLRNTDMTQLAQVKAARAAGAGAPAEPVHVAEDVRGREVLTAHAPVAPLGWLVFVELPADEAYAPLYAAILRSAPCFWPGSRSLVSRRPVSRAQHGGSDPGPERRRCAHRRRRSDQRISIRTGDELEALGDQFNSMAAQLQDSYADLERKVEERTHQLELANLAKSRFLAAASHDLRQPLHALGLFVAQLRDHIDSPKAVALVERIDAAVAAMNELFNALLDISKLDAGVLSAEHHRISDRRTC